MHTGVTFLAGANTLGFSLAALLFLRAWRRTHDVLFPFFAAAFALFALNELVMAFEVLPTQQQSLAFLLRLAGFTLLIVAIVSKNVGPGARGRT